MTARPDPGRRGFTGSRRRPPRRHDPTVDRPTPATLGELVDLETYPIHRPASDRYAQVVAEARAELDAEGCAVMAGMIRPAAVERLDAEIVERKHATHYSTQVINPYFHTTADPSYPDRHPVNTFIERSSGFIPGDAWDPGCATDTLFRARPLARFLADCLDEPELHCYADPLAGLTANILDPGQQFTWHFDTNELAVTVLVREAARGGLFQYAPEIRSAEDEGFERIQAVLEGGDLLDGGLGVRTLELRPGDLQAFRGRYSLHRVTRVPAGGGSRHAAILAYTSQPGVIGRVERTRQLFGRILPAHEEAERARIRSDSLLD